MNADTYLLLNSVLSAHGCVDKSLCNIIQTTPFAIHCVAQECYYVIYLLSSARALLLDDYSTYQTLLEQLLCQEKEVEELRLHFPSLKSVVDKLHECAIELASTIYTSPAKSNPAINSETDNKQKTFSSSLQEQASALETVNLLSESCTCKMELQNERNKRFYFTASLFAPQKSIEQRYNNNDKNNKLTEQLQIPPVQLSSSLELRLVIVGGGTVCRRLLQILLAPVKNKQDGMRSNASNVQEHTKNTLLFHPSRITVITRQPEKLNVFAALGVRCVQATHHYHSHNDLASCDILCLACQPEHLSSVVRTHFTPAQYDNNVNSCNRYNENNNKNNNSKSNNKNRKQCVSNSMSSTIELLHRNSFLKQTCVVFSCLAGVSSRKLSKLLHHPRQLILCASVNTLFTSTSLPKRKILYEEFEEEKEQPEEEEQEHHRRSLRSHNINELAKKVNKRLPEEMEYMPLYQGSCIPLLANEYETQVASCQALRVQYMADHDSFLHDAVCEAEQVQIHKTAEQIMQREQENIATREKPLQVTSTTATTTTTTTKWEQHSSLVECGKEQEMIPLLPEELRYRTALISATQATLQSHNTPSLHSFLQKHTVAPLEFICRAWSVVESYMTLLVEQLMQTERAQEMHRKMYNRKRASAETTIKSKSNGPNGKHGKPKRKERHRLTTAAETNAQKTEKQEEEQEEEEEEEEQEYEQEQQYEGNACEHNEISFTCIALAVLPSSSHIALITALRRRYLLEALSEFDDDSYTISYQTLFPNIVVQGRKHDILFTLNQENLNDSDDENDDENNNNITDNSEELPKRTLDNLGSDKVLHDEKVRETKVMNRHNTTSNKLTYAIKHHFPFAFDNNEELFDTLHIHYRNILQTVHE